MFNAAAYTCYVQGHHERMQVYLKEVFSNAKCYGDKLEAYFILVMSLGASGNLAQAYKCSMNVLEQLGETFPEPIDNEVIKASMMKTIVEMKGLGKEYFDSLPLMADKSKIYAMRLLKLTSYLSFLMNSPAGAVFACRMVNLTLKHGMAKETARGIVGFGAYVVKMTPNVEEGASFVF